VMIAGLRIVGELSASYLLAQFPFTAGIKIRLRVLDTVQQVPHPRCRARSE
jgi:hypothetical protein